VSVKLTIDRHDVAINDDLTRYRALLKISSAVGTQPAVDAVLRSLASLLSNVVSFDDIALLLFDSSGQHLILRALEHSHEEAVLEVGTAIMYAGTGLGRALKEQIPIFVPYVKRELALYPELASRVNQAESAYIFPISTARTKLGALVFARQARLEFSPVDVELMHAIAGHFAVVLENARALSLVEAYQRDLTRERDRLSFLLEVNNHVVSVLDINDLFRAASASIRKHFGNDFAGFMLFNDRFDRLKVVVLDFPASRGFMSDIPVQVARRSGAVASPPAEAADAFRHDATGDRAAAPGGVHRLSYGTAAGWRKWPHRGHAARESEREQLHPCRLGFAHSG
jgi:GAF domain-containing protein